MNEYPNLNSDNPFASQSKLFAHMDKLYHFVCEDDSYPIFMEVNLTNKCNLNCKWCISGNFYRNNEELDLNAFEVFCKEFAHCDGKAMTFSGGGEPTLHREFEQMAEVALSYGIELGLMTNGLFDPRLLNIIGNRFKWVRVSLDTIDPIKYKEGKGVDGVARVLRTLEQLKKYPVKVGANVNVGIDYTIPQASEILLFVYPLVDYIQFRPILPRYYAKEKIQINTEVWNWLSVWRDNPKVNLSLDKLKDLQEWNTFPFDVCEGHCFNPILDANGDIKVCMYHPNDPAFTLGNIYSDTLRDIWASDKRQMVRRYLEVLPYKQKCQICCKLTEINKFLDFLKKAKDIEDKNFL